MDAFRKGPEILRRPAAIKPVRCESCGKKWMVATEVKTCPDCGGALVPTGNGSTQ